MKFDLLITNAVVVTVNCKGEIHMPGAVGVRNGKIVYVGPMMKEAANGPVAHRIVDAENGVLIPGLVNTHTHMPMTLFRGLADDLPLMEWLHEHIFPAEKMYIRPDTVGVGARLACVEMLLSGTTTCCDGYFLEDAVAEAVIETGLRAVLGHGVIDFPAPGVPDPKHNVAVALDFVKGWKDKNRRIYPAIFCHSPYTCSAATLQKAKQAAEDENVLFLIHLAETRFELEQIRKERGCTPVGYLQQLNLLDPKTLLVHAVWLEDDDIKRLAESGVSVSHNAESNAKLAAGIAPVCQMRKAKIPVGLGTDGCASNNNHDLFREMDFTAKLHKVHLADPTALDVESVLQMATIEGARTLGLDHMIGSIEKGKQADLVLLYPDRPHLLPLYHPVSQVVYAASGADVRHVFVSGQPLVEEGQPTRIDLPALMKAATEIAKTMAQP